MPEINDRRNRIDILSWIQEVSVDPPDYIDFSHQLQAANKFK